jgi:transcriptional regulator with XRE-family HTH domain
MTNWSWKDVKGAKGAKNARRGRRGPIDPELDQRIGKLIRSRRIELGLSQQALGKKLGITFQQVQKYERGDNQLSVARLLQMCDALTVAVAYFLDGKSEPVASRRIDYEAARAMATVRDPRIKAALVRLARQCR